jgi:hypothetical protein
MNPIDVKDLLKEAEKSEYNEFYKLVERNENYRIGVGIELAPSGQPLFFIETVVRLCADIPKLDLNFLERTLLFLKELNKRGYSVFCEDDSSVTCQKLIGRDDVNTECLAVKSIASRTY